MALHFPQRRECSAPRLKQLYGDSGVGIVYLSPSSPSLMLPGTRVAGNHSVLTAVFFNSSQLVLTAMIAWVGINKSFTSNASSSGSVALSDPVGDTDANSVGSHAVCWPSAVCNAAMESLTVPCQSRLGSRALQWSVSHDSAWKKKPAKSGSVQVLQFEALQSSENKTLRSGTFQLSGTEKRVNMSQCKNISDLVTSECSNNSEFCRQWVKSTLQNIYICISISVQWVCSVRAKKAQLKSETLEVRSQFKTFSGSGNTQLFQMGPQ